METSNCLHYFCENKSITNILNIIDYEILSVAIALISVFSITAQEIIPIYSVSALNKEQKKTKKYAEKLLKSQKNKILLPIEFNSLIGDSLTNTPYELGINWDNAYFAKSDNKCANLYIPLKSDKEGVQPLLNVFRDEDGKYYRIVITYKQMQTDSIKEEIVMRSNIDGLFLNAFVLNNEKLVCQINGVVGDYGVKEGKSKALYIRSRIYNRFCTTGYPYEMSYADSYEYLLFNTNPVKKWGRVKTY